MPLRAQTLTLPSAAPAVPNGVQVEGAFVTAPVTLDGVTLFRLAVRGGPTAGASAAFRASDVATALAQVVAPAAASSREATAYDPRTLRVHVRRASDLAALEAVDAAHADPLPLVTVTTVDASYAGESIEAVATQWQQILQSALTRALQLRQPAVERRSARRVEIVLGLLLVATFAVWALTRSLRSRIAALGVTIDARDRTMRSEAEGAGRASERGDETVRRRRRFLASAVGNVEPARRLRWYRGIIEVSLWALLLGWFAAFGWAIALFPDASPLAARLMQIGFGIFTTIVVAALANRLLDLAIDRVAQVWQSGAFAGSDDRARLLLRIPTAARAIAGFKTVVVAFVAALAVLEQTGVPIGSVVTIGGLTAVALSLAAQNFVRDFLNGTLVLVEDQYVVGDFVTINGYGGVVERLTLRMVQVRDASGDLITMPHSSVTAVVNQSRDWSRVDYRVSVDPAGDVAHAVALLQETIEGLASDDAWRASILQPVEWIGIDALGKDGAILRVSVRTAPLRQFALRREINARMLAAFAHAGIGLGVPPALP